MILEINALNVPRAYSEMWWKARNVWVEEQSRNGSVLTVPYPSLLTIRYPLQRVLFDPIRDANPFFHVAEWIWMMAGSNDAEWISQFNKRMSEYADDGVLRGAYGWRWRHPRDQISNVIDLLQHDPNTRQAVISMWDPVYDGAHAKTSDRPCNTHIYFRHTNGLLDMTVCNRSNDMVWGMLGANAVHMTYLHELVALSTKIPIGDYRVFTNNLHFYPDMPNGRELKKTTDHYDCYGTVKPDTLLVCGETYEDLMADCIDMVYHSQVQEFRTYWVTSVGYPMIRAYLDRENRDEWISKVRAEDWKLAALQWVERRSISKPTHH
jgi:hypothetical protein